MLSVMEMPQGEGFEPTRIQAGERIEIRLGYCCPRIEEATIIASADDRIEMALGATIWRLRPGGGRIDIPGILSNDWVVA